MSKKTHKQLELFKELNQELVEQNTSEVINKTIVEENVVEEVNEEQKEIPSTITLTDEEVVLSYLNDEKVRKNLIETLLYYKKKLYTQKNQWFTFDQLIATKVVFKAGDIKAHLRLLSLMKMIYSKIDAKNREVYRITDTVELRLYILNTELEFHQNKVKTLQDEIELINSTVDLDLTEQEKIKYQDKMSNKDS